MTRLDLNIGEVGAQVFLRGPGITDTALDPQPALVSAITHAKKSIYALIFSITLTSVRDALIAAHQRGVEVHIVADATEVKGATSCIPALVAAGLDVHVWGGNYQEAHDKVAIIDGDILITGSYNWSALAEYHNIENMVILTGSRVARSATPAYMAQWNTAYAAGAALGATVGGKKMSDVAPTQPPTIQPPSTDEPLTSVQSQIGLLVVAVLTVIAFIFHKDFSALAPALSTIALAMYGAAVAIARAIKHRTVMQAQMVHNQQRLEAWTATQQQVNTAQQLRKIDTRLNAVEDVVTTPSPTTTGIARKRATVAPKKTSRARSPR